jgi:hypothetical protein
MERGEKEQGKKEVEGVKWWALLGLRLRVRVPFGLSFRFCFLLNFCVSLPWNTCIFDICFYNTLFLCKCVIDTLRKHLV